MRIEKGDIRKQGKEKMKFGFQEGDSRSNGEEKKGKREDRGAVKEGWKGRQGIDGEQLRNGMKRTMSKREKRKCNDGERRGEERK